MFSTGARTPLLALFALRRPRNLAAVLLPYVALTAFALLAADPAVTVLALSPSPLIGGLIARSVGAREENVAALMAGTLAISLAVLPASVPSLATTVNIGLAAVVLGVIVAGSFPRVRDAILPALDPARYAAVGIIVGLAAITSLPLVDGRSLALAAAMLVLGALSAAIGARAFGGDALVAAIGGGTRDFAVAGAILMAAGIAGGAVIPLAYAGLLGLAAALGKLVVGRKA